MANDVTTTDARPGLTWKSWESCGSRASVIRKQTATQYAAAPSRRIERELAVTATLTAGIAADGALPC